MWENIKEYIKVEDLKDGYLYEICARNSSLGIWMEEKGSFLISRFKFGNNYLFEEVHWDLSDDFGTVKPIKEIEKVLFENPGKRRSQSDIMIDSEKFKNNKTFQIFMYENEKELLEYLNKKRKGLF